MFRLLVLCIPAASLAADVDVSASRTGDSFEVSASAEIVADAAVAWAVLTDYDHFSEFIPGMHSSRVVERNGHALTVDQRGEASMLVFSFPIEVRLAVEETPYETISSHAVSGNFKELSGAYRLETRGPRLLLTYSGRFTPDFDIPYVVGTMVVRHTLEKRFRAMVGEILRRQALSGKGPAESAS